MNGYKLKQLSIENFKVFEQRREFIFYKDDNSNVENSNVDNVKFFDLFMLDGPNGYGKTTVFDALELLLCGKVERLEKNRSLSPQRKFRDGCLLARNPSAPIIIKAEFMLSKKGLTNTPKILQVILEQPMDDQKCDRSFIWSNYEWQVLSDFNDNNTHNGLRQSYDNKFIKQFFNINDNVFNFQENYKKLFYISQEDNTHFLENKHSERASYIESFINNPFATSVKNMESIKDRINELRKELDKFQAVIKVEMEKIQTSIDDFKLPIDPRANGDCILETELEYISLGTNQEWDLPEQYNSISVGNYSPIDIMASLEILKTVTDNVNILTIMQNNDIYNKIVYDYKVDIKLQNYCILYGISDSIDRLEKQSRDCDKFNRIIEIIETQDYEKFCSTQIALELPDIYKRMTSKNQFNKSTLDQELKDIEMRCKQIALTNTTNNGLSQLLAKIQDTRKLLEIRYDEFKNNEDLKKINIGFSEESCPFCGSEVWGNEINNLQSAFKVKYDDFAKLQEESAGDLRKNKDELFQTLSGQLSCFLKHYAKQHYVDEDFLNQLKEEKDRSIGQERIYERTCKYFTSKLSVDFLDEINKTVKDLRSWYSGQRIPDDKLSKVIQDIKLLLKSQFQKIDCDLEVIDSINSSVGFYGNSYRKVVEAIKNGVLSIENIENNKKYFQQLNSRKIKDLTAKSRKLEGQYNRIEMYKNIYSDCINQFTKLHQKLKDAQKQYNQKITNEIKIPLFIYSSKILQSTQRGCGILLDYEIDCKSPRLVFLSSNQDNDYDALLSMSSGQLSALVIALTLTFNKVYATGLNVLLIDDPMQTMDDINIISLIELIRNEFSDKQLIMSTHENNISRLIRYKYRKYGLKEKSYNLSEIPQQIKNNLNTYKV